MTNDPTAPPGITENEGADAAAASRKELRRTKRAKSPMEASLSAEMLEGDGSAPTPAENDAAASPEAFDDGDPLSGLAARIAAAGRPELALDALAIAAAAELRDDDGPAFGELCRELKAAGVGLTEWKRALDAHARTAKREAKARARAMAREAWEAERAAAEARRAEERAAWEAEREAARATELAAHYSETPHDEGVFVMRPGRIERITTNKHGEDVVQTLGYFSATILQRVSVHQSPAVRPEQRLTLSLCTKPSRPPRREEFSAADFDRMLWPINVGAIVSAGPGVREQLRCAIELVSRAEEVVRFGFTGWHRGQDGWRYLTADRVLGSAGPEQVLVEGFAAPYALPAPVEGEALLEGLCRLAGLLSLEPRGVLVPLLGAAFRAPLGPARCVIHLAGPPEVGKTYAALWFARLFGPRVEALDWNASSAVGLKRSLATVGEALVVLDDLKKHGTRADEDINRKSDEVFRSLFNRTGAAKGQRTGGVRAEPSFRCLALSTGEVTPGGHSVRTRIAMLEMDRRAEGLPAENLSGVMAAFVAWLAPQIDALQEPGALEALDRDAAERFGIPPTARAAEVFGAIALGLEYFDRFAREQGVEIDMAFVRQTILEAAGASAEETAAENPAPRGLELLGAALRAGLGHVKQLRPDGRLGPPIGAAAWGWESDPIAVWRSRGPCVGYLSHACPGELLLDRSSAVALMREQGMREGHPIAVDAKVLGISLARSKFLARTDGRNLAVKVSLDGVRTRLLAVRLTAFEDPNEPLPPSAPEGGA